MAAVTFKERIQALLFLALAALALAAIIVALVGWNPTRPQRNYRLRFVDSVASIEEGLPVRYKGLRCGKVARMRIDPGDPGAILVTIAVDPATPITRSTTARIGSNSILGPYFIELAGSLAGESELGAEAEIPVEASTLSRILRTGETLGDQLPALLTQAQTWFEAERRERFFTAVDEVGQLARRAREVLDESEAELRGLITAWREVGERSAAVIEANEGDLRRLLQEAQRTATTLRVAIEDARIPLLSERVESAVLRAGEDLAATAAAVREFLARNDLRPELAGIRSAAERLALDVGSEARALSAEGRSTLRRDLGPALQEIARAALALERLASLLERAPRSLLFGAPEPEKPLPRLDR
jgi:phospholipid/cholesterol/gamma-HCH transport system substrate-binding protein